MSEGGGQVDEKGDETLSDVVTRAAGVGDDLRQQTFESVHTEPREDLTETLSGTLSVDTRGVASERDQKAVDEVGEAILSQSLDERTERLGSRTPCFGHRVDKDDVNERHELGDYTGQQHRRSARNEAWRGFNERTVRSEVFGIREGRPEMKGTRESVEKGRDQEQARMRTGFQESEPTCACSEHFSLAFLAR